MRTSRFVQFTAAVLVLTACQSFEMTAPGDRSPHESGGPVAITTNADRYTLTPEWVGLKTTIGIRFENRSTARMYIVNCHGGLAPVLQKRVDGSWVNYWSPAVLSCLSPPIVIEPGASISRDVHVWGALPGNNAAPAWASADVEGTYRMVLTSVVWNYNDSRQGFGDPVPLNLRTSSEFTLVK